MGMFDKLFKRKDDLGLNLGLPPEEHAMPQQDFSQQQFSPQPYQQQPAFQQFQQPNYQPDQMMNKNFELISAKMDSLKVSLDAINQRLANLERSLLWERR